MTWAHEILGARHFDIASTDHIFAWLRDLGIDPAPDINNIHDSFVITPHPAVVAMHAACPWLPPLSATDHMRPPKVGSWTPLTPI